MQKIIRQKISELDDQAKDLISFADQATTNKFFVQLPRLWWILLLVTLGSIITISITTLLTMIVILEGLKDFNTLLFFPVIFILVASFDYITIQKIINYINVKKYPKQYYLYLHPEYFVERAKDIVTIIPKGALLYAYEKYAYFGFHIAYKGDGLSTYRYQLMNDHSIHYNYTEITGSPSPIRKKIMEIYSLTLPPKFQH